MRAKNCDIIDLFDDMTLVFFQAVLEFLICLAYQSCQALVIILKFQR